MKQRIALARRVFILGAGASKACGLPLTSELLQGVLSHFEEEKTRKQLLRFIRYLYPHFKSRWANFPNLEELLSLMDIYTAFSEKVKRNHLFDPKEVAQLKDQLLRAICVLLCSKSSAANMAKTRLYELAGCFRPGDAIVTFNWDYLMEAALVEAEIGWSYEEDRHKVMLLKPHGSVDWFDSNAVRLKKGRSFPLIHNLGRIRVFDRFRFPEVRSEVIPVIVPPITQKTWKYREFDRIWRATWLSLRRADEVYVLGFSLPPEDLHVRFVMRSALRANESARDTPLRIVVVNPDQHVMPRFSRLIHSQVEFLETRLERIALEELLSKKPGEG